MLDNNMRYVLASQKWISDFRLNVNELYGRSHYDLFPEIPEHWKEIHKRALAGETIRNDQEKFVRADGSIDWIKWEIRPWHEDDQSIGGVIIFSENISEQLKTEAEAKFQAELTKTITDNAASCLFMMDKLGRPTFMNPAANVVTGYESLDEIKDRPLHYAVHWKKADGSPYPIEECPIDNAQAGLKEARDQEEIFCRKDGTLFPVSYSIKPLQRNGEVVGSVLEFRDITEQKRNEEALKDAVRARDEFLSIASHELKTPLTSLKLQAQIFKRKATKNDPSVYEKPFVDDLVSQTEKQVTRLNRLVDDMLDIARIRSGKLLLEREEFDLCALMREVVERMRPQFANSKSTPPGLDLCEEAVGFWDRMRLEQVITNLFTNAIRYGQGNPIKVQVHTDGDLVRFCVLDQGIGIAKENQEKVFDRFERAVSASEVSGLGLGLFIAKQIVVAHGGKIWVESEVGKGSKFVVELPSSGGKK